MQNERWPFSLQDLKQRNDGFSCSEVGHGLCTSDSRTKKTTLQGDSFEMISPHKKDKPVCLNILSHTLKTPLTSLKLELQLALRRLSGQEKLSESEHQLKDSLEFSLERANIMIQMICLVLGEA
ncbi:hypothetical protein EBR03_05450 [bacterium]|nr:hypothetical protein [bacterium]